MLRRIILAICLFGAGTVATLAGPFSPAPLSPAETRYMQAALSAEGHYLGLIDGAWGPMTEAALAAYAAETWDGPLDSAHVGTIAFLFAEALDRDGWRVRRLPELDLSLALPERGLVQVADEGGARIWHNPATGLAVRAWRGGADQAGHDAVLAAADPTRHSYVLRRDDRLVTSAFDHRGRVWYLRSDRQSGNAGSGGWRHVELSVPAAGIDTLRTISSSLAEGAAPDWTLPPDGILSRAMADIGSRFDEVAPGDIRDASAR
jgi:hypothetical protein